MFKPCFIRQKKSHILILWIRIENFTRINFKKKHILILLYSIVMSLDFALCYMKNAVKVTHSLSVVTYWAEEEWQMDHQHQQHLLPKFQPSSYTLLNHAVQFLFLVLLSLLLVLWYLFFFVCLFLVVRSVYTVLLIILYHVTGFRWDRQWMVVNSQGRMYTQRVEPRLALVEVELPSEAFLENWEPTQDSYMGILHFLNP